MENPINARPRSTRRDREPLSPIKDRNPNVQSINVDSNSAINSKEIIKVFQSSPERRNNSKSGIGNSLAIARNHSSDDRAKYEIEFPPGAMGLDLEPVLISSERQLGCRVKDFYFAVDHVGISKDYVEKAVNIGDIIYHIDGKSMLSVPFQEILSTLRALKSQYRIVGFKNVSASWNSTSIADIEQSINDRSDLSDSASTISSVTDPSLPSPTRIKSSKKKGERSHSNTHNRSMQSSVFSAHSLNAASPSIRIYEPQQERQHPISARKVKPLPRGLSDTSVLPSSILSPQKRTVKSISPSHYPPQIQSQVNSSYIYQRESNSQIFDLGDSDSMSTHQVKLILSPRDVKRLSHSGRLNLQSPISGSSVNALRRTDSSSTFLSTSYMQQQELLNASLASASVSPPQNNLKDQSRNESNIMKTPDNDENNQSGNVNGMRPTPDQDLYNAFCNLDDGEMNNLPSGLGLAGAKVGALVMSRVTPANVGMVLQQVSSTVGFVGREIISVGAVVGGRAAEAALTVGAAVGERALTVGAQAANTALEATAKYAPRYNDHEMNSVVERKNSLLHELSHVCVLLGVAEERQTTMGQELEHSVKEVKLLRGIQQDNEHTILQQSSKILAVELELAAVRSDRDSWAARSTQAERGTSKKRKVNQNIPLPY